MIKHNRKLFWLVLLLPIFGCSNTVKVEIAKPKKLVQQSSTCPIIETGKWHAWLDKYEQKEGSYRLNVSGEVTLPNPSYEFEWSVGPTDRMSPPGLRLFLKPRALDGMSIQVITHVPISYKIPTPIADYRHVSVYCEGKLLSQIRNVMLTD